MFRQIGSFIIFWMVMVDDGVSELSSWANGEYGVMDPQLSIDGFRAPLGMH